MRLDQKTKPIESVHILRCLLACALFFLPSDVTADVFTVTRTNNTGPGSLPFVLLQANASRGQHTIEIAVNGTLYLVDPLPVVTNSIVVQANTNIFFVIDGRRMVPLFELLAGTTNVLSGLTLRNGWRSAGDGGAIRNFGTLIVSECVIQGSSATNGAGGALANSGKLTLIETQFLTNSALRGGAIVNAGSIDILKGSFVGNSTTISGGAIDNAGALNISSAQFHGNIVSSGIGGAIANGSKGVMTLDQADLTGNQAFSGGAVANLGVGAMTESRLSFNSAGHGGAIYASGSLELKRLVIESNLANGGFGGGIHNTNGTLVINESAIVRNRAFGGDGQNGSVGQILQETATRPTATSGGGGGGGGGGGAGLGGGIFIWGKTTMTNCTVSENTAQGGAPGAEGLSIKIITRRTTDFTQARGGLFGAGGGGGAGASTSRPGSTIPISLGGNGGAGGGLPASIGGSGSPYVQSQTDQQRGQPGGFGAGRGGSGGALGQPGGSGVGGNGFGGGIFLGSDSAEMLLVNCTIASNTALGGSQSVAASGGGIFVYTDTSSISGTAQLRNTIVANNKAFAQNQDLAGKVKSLGYNLVSVDQSLGASGLGVFDFLNEPAFIGPLEDNGGDTLTHALLLGSAAIGAGGANGAPQLDQRGVERPPGRIDIGAFQLVTRIVPAISWPNPQSIVFGTPLSAVQLNATTAIPGSFSYSPPAGTILKVGEKQRLIATFIPQDLVTYGRATNFVLIDVRKVGQSISFPVLADRRQNDPPFILNSATASSGLPVKMEVLSGPAALQGNVIILSGALGLVTVAASQEGNDIFNPAPNVQRSFNVVSLLAPLIITQPQSQIVAPGETITLSVVAQGQALSYQWRFQGIDIAGATGASLTIAQVTEAQEGTYRVFVRSPNGSITSSEANLIVKSTIRIQRSGSGLTLSWSNGRLQTGSEPLGPWLDLPNTSPFAVNMDEKSRFYRVAR